MAQIFDLQKLFATAPTFDVKALFEVQTRNAEAFLKAFEVVSKTARTVAQRQADQFQGNLKDVAAHTEKAFQVQNVQSAMNQQVAFLKDSADKLAAQARELSELTAKGNADAYAILRQRAEQVAAEVQSLTASTSALTPAATAAPAKAAAKTARAESAAA
ncbi:MAG TPA: phasin family protein [Arenibaculum sp.]|nr:phasin family protein [Arenibaculum sp.]